MNRKVLKELDLLFTGHSLHKTVFVFRSKDTFSKLLILKHRRHEDPEAIADELRKKLV